MTLSGAEIEKLWRAFLEHQTAYFVAAKCGVSPTTAWKYRYSRNWDERLRKIRVRASALADSKVPLHPAKDVEVVQDIQMKIVESIQERLEAGNYKPTVRDYDRLVRLERFLRGSSDRRTKPPNNLI